MINCGECSGSKQALCMEAMDRFNESFVEVTNRFDESELEGVDAFALAQGVGNIGRLLAGDQSALEDIQNDPVFGINTDQAREQRESIETLVSDISSIGCELEPQQIVFKGIFGALQNAILDDLSTDINFEAILPVEKPERPSLIEELGDDVSDSFRQAATKLDELMTTADGYLQRPAFETREQRSKRLEGLVGQSDQIASETRKLIEATLKDVEKGKQAERTEYIQSQGWDPDNLNFSQKLDIKAHLKELGYK